MLSSRSKYSTQITQHQQKYPKNTRLIFQELVLGIDLLNRLRLLFCFVMLHLKIRIIILFKYPPKCQNKGNCIAADRLSVEIHVQSNFVVKCNCIWAIPVIHFKDNLIFLNLWGALVSFLGTCITKRRTHNCPKVLLGYEILSQ